jgi:hypothetical protein
MRLLVCLLLLLAPGLAFAKDARMRLVQPRGSTLTILQVSRDADVRARFAGRTWITGTVVGRWPLGAADPGYETPDYILVPDAPGIRRLPYWLLREPPYLNRYRITGIELTNGEQALRLAVGATEANRLRERKVDQVRATGTFLIEALEIGVECDAPWAKARLVQAKVPVRVAARHGEVVEGC